MKTTNSLKHLFVSVTRQKLINIFFYSPKEIFYVRQLVRLVDEEINSVRRELDNLKKASIIQSERRGNRLYYSTNRQSSLFTDLLILANKSSGLGLAIQEKKDLVGQIKLLMYSYKFALHEEKSKDSIDLIIVGDISFNEIESIIKQEENKRGQEINYMVMDKSEFHLRRQKRDPFIIDFFLEYPVIIIGSPQEIINS
jgi:hypothetical protein